jgi:Trk K+ transport system NAD-binding subunit
VDTNWKNVTAARVAGPATYYGSALREDTLDDLDLDGIDRLLALTSDDKSVP